MSTNAIKWTPGRPPEPRNGNQYICYCTDGRERWISTLHVTGGVPVTIIAHALINYPLNVSEAVHRIENENSWYYWDLNGTTRSTGYATREEAEAAYHNEYGDW